jgi:hypothetical protein
VGAEVVSAKRILCFDDIPKQPITTGNISATNSIVNSTIENSFNTTNNIYLPPGSVEEHIAYVKALSFLADSGKLQVVLQGDSAAVPAMLSKMTREIDPRLDNKYINNNDVVSRVDGTKTPLVRHAKKEVPRLMGGFHEALQLPIDAMGLIDNKVYIETDDVHENRRKLLSVVYSPETADRMNKIIDVTYDTIGAVEHVETMVEKEQPYNAFYLGCKLLAEDPSMLRWRVPDDVKDQVKHASKLYQSCLPREKKKRPTNVLP